MNALPKSFPEELRSEFETKATNLFEKDPEFLHNTCDDIIKTMKEEEACFSVAAFLPERHQVLIESILISMIFKPSNNM